MTGSARSTPRISDSSTLKTALSKELERWFDSASGIVRDWIDFKNEADSILYLLLQHQAEQPPAQSLNISPEHVQKVERIERGEWPLHPSYEDQLALVESMMTCYDTPLTQAAGYTRDLLKSIIALQQRETSDTDLERVAKTIYYMGRRNAAEQMEMQEDELLTFEAAGASDDAHERFPYEQAMEVAKAVLATMREPKRESGVVFNKEAILEDGRDISLDPAHKINSIEDGNANV